MINISTNGQQKISINSQDLLQGTKITNLVFEKAAFLEIKVSELEEKA
jgi:hypothetical protein